MSDHYKEKQIVVDYDYMPIDDFGVDLDMPERRLWAAVLYNAIVDYQRLLKSTYHVRDPKTARNTKDVEAWFVIGDCNSVGSFIWICEQLSNDAHSFANKVLKRLKTLNTNPVDLQRKW